jgi:hypothetical protein
MELGIPGLPPGADLTTYAAFEHLLDGKFYLKSPHCAACTLPTGAQRLRDDMIRRARTMARAQMVADNWADDGSQFVRAALYLINERMAHAGAIHAGVLGDEGRGSVPLDLEHVDLMIERGVLEGRDLEALVAALGAALTELTHVPSAHELCARAAEWVRGLRGPTDAARVLLTLVEAAGEVQIAYINLLMARTAITSDRVAERIATELGVGALCNLERDLVARVVDAAPTPTDGSCYLDGPVCEAAVLCEVALAASFAELRGADGDDVHRALCGLLRVERLRVDADRGVVAAWAREDAELDNGLRGARQRARYAQVRPDNVRLTVFQATGVRVLPDDPLGRLLRSRLRDAAQAALDTGDACRAPRSIVMAEPFCRAVDRLARAAALHQVAAGLSR